MGFLWVGLGGALGAMGRYGISLSPVKSDFPVLTLITNMIGAVMIGFIAAAASKRGDITPSMLLFLKTGVCGGFTTFSTFSLEAYQLFENQSYFLGGLYTALSVAGCLAGIWCGKRLAML